MVSVIKVQGLALGDSSVFLETPLYWPFTQFLSKAISRRDFSSPSLPSLPQFLHKYVWVLHALSNKCAVSSFITYKWEVIAGS